MFFSNTQGRSVERMPASNDRIYFLLQIAAHQLRKEADTALLQKAGLTTAQIAVLNLIASGKQVNQRELAQQLHQNESAMTAMVQRLLKAGHIKRHRNPKDGRNWVLEITETGQQVLEDGRSAFKTINAKLDKTIGAKGTKSLAAQLTKLVKTFSDEI